MEAEKQTATEQGISEKLLGNILEELKKQRITDRLWDTDDIAVYTGLAVKTIQNKTLTHQSFPSPVVLPTGGKRWKADDVRRWADRRKLTKA